MPEPSAARSLAVRLSWWYGISSCLLIAIVTGFLYLALLRNFAEQSERYLAEKVSILRTLLEEPGDQAATVKWEVEEDLAAHPLIRVLSRVISGNGTSLYETSGMSEELPASAFTGKSGGEVRSPRGRVYRVLRASVPANGQTFEIQAAIDLGYQEDLLTHYQNELWIALAVGFTIALFVGHRIAHRGIEPVKLMAAAVKGIRSHTLDERIRLEDPPSELAALSEAFNQTLDRLQDVFDRLSQFSSDIAHELRTPINNVRGELEVALTRSRTASQYQEAIGSALEECQRVSRLIDSLLFLARAEHPETGVHREPLHLSSELDKLVLFYEAAAHERAITLEAHVPEDLYADLDRNLLQRALGNLMENAFRYTPPGGRVTLGAKDDRAQLLLTVTDTGPGIPEAHVARIFDRFYRVDTARTAAQGGTGLGLAIVKSIARLHGGEVRIDTAEGRGTSVTLAFGITKT
ncbi:MAG: heavy metal sensor histidine kinase [Bryobacteraceae bacterium]